MIDAVRVEVSSSHGPARIDLERNHDFNLRSAAGRVEGCERPVGRAQITVRAIRIHESAGNRAAFVNGLSARAWIAVGRIKRSDGATRTAHETVLVVLRVVVGSDRLTRPVDRKN